MSTQERTYFLFCSILDMVSAILGLIFACFRGQTLHSAALYTTASLDLGAQPNVRSTDSRHVIPAINIVTFTLHKGHRTVRWFAPWMTSIADVVGVTAFIITFPGYDWAFFNWDLTECIFFSDFGLFSGFSIGRGRFILLKHTMVFFFQSIIGRFPIRSVGCCIKNSLEVIVGISDYRYSRRCRFLLFQIDFPNSTWYHVEK